LYHLLRGHRKNVVVCAFTGVAACLLPEGKSCHKLFGLSVPLLSDSSSKIKGQTAEAKRLRECDVVIWDEAPMAPRYALEVADKVLRELMNSNLPFGGKTMLLGGDFCQLLPVLKYATVLENINLSICASTLWRHFEQFELTVNMRARPNEQEFVEYLKKVGNGSMNDGDEKIELPENCIEWEPLSRIIYSEMIENEDYGNMYKVTILVSKHDGVDRTNDEVLEMLPGEITEYRSIDTAVEADTRNRQTDAHLFTPEYLNSIREGSLPPHVLQLKKFAIVMLLRNLNVDEGLCNGTRMIVLDMKPHAILCQIASGSKKGEQHWIPRINVTSDQRFFTINRKQFPLKLAFSMTINKAQGQTFEKVGIDLQYEVFSHGQMYVALSRARSWDSVHVNLGEFGTRFVKNFVYKEIFEKMRRR
jgi:hypothetical protein